MNYWWVNQKQTYRYEVPGGYMWSPKLNGAGQHTRAYDLMKLISPGDVVFSFADAKIKAVGIANSNCYEFPKPTEFGAAGQQWSDVGWRVEVNYIEIFNPIRPKDHIGLLRSVLPGKYSPLQPATGNGNQHSYLYDITEKLAFSLARLMERSVLDLIQGNVALDILPDRSRENISAWEDRVEVGIQKRTNIGDTERTALISARRGQGEFRQNLYKIEKKCRITQVGQSQHLVASHTKPWRDCSDDERLDPENGFMLTPTVDHLFDKGFISFENNGELLISPVAHRGSLIKMGLQVGSRLNVGTFSQGQKEYLQWHREQLLLVT